MSSVRIFRTPIDCIVMSGQSNMEGGSDTGDPLPEYLLQPNTIMFHKHNNASSTANGALETLRFGRNQMWRIPNLLFSGPELSLGYKHYQETGKRLLIIKYAYSGSLLVDDGVNVSTTGLWDVNASPARVNGLPHYSNLINNFVIPGLLKAKAAGFIVNLKAFSWCQGEGDALSEVRSAAYEGKLIQLIDKFVEDVTPYNVLSPNFKPIITRIHNNFDPVRTYQNEVRAALDNVAVNYGTTAIDSDAYPLESDFTHFTRSGEGSGQQLHGEAILEKFLEI